MSVAETSSSLAVVLELFAQTEVFIFVFIEIATKLHPIKRVMYKRSKLKDYIVFITLFGLYSIFGTYIGTVGTSGAISNIRDLAPMIAGLVGGPVVGVAVGLIGGIHRLFLGGVTSIPCALATILAGLIAGLIFKYKKDKVLGIIPAILFAFAIELMHTGLVLIMVQPFAVALDIVLVTVPKMLVAVTLGMGVSIIVIHSNLEKDDKSITSETENRIEAPELVKKQNRVRQYIANSYLLNRLSKSLKLKNLKS